MNKSIDLLKKEQRNIAIKKRLKIKDFTNLKNNFYYKKICQNNWFNQSKTIASFLSINTEISTIEINNFIQSSNKILCLPSIVEKSNGVLVFKSFSNIDKLTIGKFGIKEPLNTKIYLPDIILVPCLAFDNSGHRLGYGGGYYDRSISYLKSIEHDFVTIGLAYDDQRVEKVVHDNYDQKLNYILTEKQLYEMP